MTELQAKLRLGVAAPVMILSTSTNGHFPVLNPSSAVKLPNAAGQHLAADGARMQQPITKNALQK